MYIPSMKCEAQVCTVKSNGYQSCEVEATHVSDYGWLFCETHRSPRDTRLTAPKSFVDALLAKRDEHEFNDDHFGQPNYGHDENTENVSK